MTRRAAESCQFDRCLSCAEFVGWEARHRPLLSVSLRLSRRKQPPRDGVSLRGTSRVKRDGGPAFAATPLWRDRLRLTVRSLLVGRLRSGRPGRSSPEGRAKSGWEAGIRTPITASRAPCPTVERPPNWQVETLIIPCPVSSTLQRRPRLPRASRFRCHRHHRVDEPVPALYGEHGVPPVSYTHLTLPTSDL